MINNLESYFIMGAMPEFMYFSSLFAAKASFLERGSEFLSSVVSVSIIRVILFCFCGRTPVSGGMNKYGVRICWQHLRHRTAISDE